VPEREGRRAWVEILQVAPAAPAAPDFATTLLPAPEITPRPRLGVQIDQEYEGEGVRIDAVEADSPAAAAGFAEGDVLVKAGDVPIAGPADMLRLRAYLESLSGAEGTFTVKRAGQEVVLKATPKAIASDRPPPAPELGYERPSGRIEAQRAAPGLIEVRTRGVAAFRLHLAPPIWTPGEKLTVRVNGKTAYEGVPEPDVTGMLAAAVRGGPLAPIAFATLRLVP
jgi:membrane-associated protease RseP (regulator of RpoE activity)